jgi:hypothetical protein
MAAHISDVSNTVSSNSSKWNIETDTSPHMTPDRNSVKSFCSDRGNVFHANKTQVEYTGVGSVHLLWVLPSEDMSVLVLCRVRFVPSLEKSLNSWNSITSIRKFTLIGAGGLQVAGKIDRSVLINTF